MTQSQNMPIMFNSFAAQDCQSPVKMMYIVAIYKFGTQNRLWQQVTSLRDRKRLISHMQQLPTNEILHIIARHTMHILNMSKATITKLFHEQGAHIFHHKSIFKITSYATVLINGSPLSLCLYNVILYYVR